MTTGQSPRRRESDAQAKRRADQLDERRKAREHAGTPLRLPPAWPRIGSGGRLQ